MSATSTPTSTTSTIKSTLLSSTSSPLLSSSPSPFNDMHSAERSHMAWSAGAFKYDTYLTKFFMEYSKQAIEHVKQNMSQQNMSLTHHSNILDVGTGTGAFALTAIEQGYQHVVAVDYAPDMITKLQQTRDQLGIPSSQLACHVMDGMNLTFPDNTFDACFAMFVVMFYPDQLTGLKSIHRVLKQGGHVCIGAWAPMDQMQILQANNKALLSIRPTLPRIPTLAANMSDPVLFKKLMTEAGFVDVEIIPVPHTFVIEDPGNFWICLAEAFPALRHNLLTHFTPEERIRVQQEFINIVNKEYMQDGQIKLKAVALLGLGRVPSNP